MNTAEPQVSVIIAAWNAEETIGRAIVSAFREPEVAEVLVADDASSDSTVSVAQAADDGSGRLSILRSEANAGPSAARNRAIAASSAPLIALLDADDYFVEGRFKRLLAHQGWDAIADNIRFIGEDKGHHRPFTEAVGNAPQSLSLAEFIRGNLSRSGFGRRELGFMKPVFARSFLDRHGLQYDERLRLGEDYALYCRMLAKGARFVRLQDCGYVAVERAGSLSGSHRTQDLADLLDFDLRLAQEERIDTDARTALAEHRRQLEAKLHHRTVLDLRRQGIGKALAHAARWPRLFPALAAAIARDKWIGHRPRSREADHLFG